MKNTLAKFFVMLFIVAMNGMINAQNQPINFEAGGHGATWTWTVFENNTNPPVEIVANPDPSGINTSSTVAKFTALQSGMPWAGFESQHGSDIGTFTLNASNSTVKIMVWKSVISDVGLKFVLPNGEALPEIKVANTLINQWEELTFDFSGRIGHPATLGQDQIVVFPDFTTRTADQVVYIDNITFSASGPVAGEPTAAAPTPTLPATDVISLFSNAYTNVTVDTWSADWDQADVVDIQIQGNDTKKYTNLVFAGIEFTSQPINATAMTHFNMDIWTPDPTAAPAVFRIKLVDFGANGVFGGGDDTEHEITLTASSTPGITTGNWVSLKIPFTLFTGLVNRGHLAQLIISGDPNTVYVDNVYFSIGGGGGTPTVPTVAAPTPNVPATNAISLFSNAYTNVTVDTWSADWDQADVADVQIAGNDTKLYTNLVFAGIEFISQTVNASAMTHFHMDIWTPDATSAGVFRIKLVDFGADGAFGGGDDTEHELTFNASSTPPLVTGEWVRFDIPFTAFTGLVNRGHLAQLIISGDPNTVYVDNVYFHNMPTDIKEITTELPSDFSLGQNYPNPFNPSTVINFTLPEASDVTLKVYNMLGQEVKTLINQLMSAGKYEVTFDATGLPSGNYIYTLNTGSSQLVKKMMLMK